ncbi:gag/pol protein [Cucumis melo var. makuwa]|uniref:Gag/pol protein n=1 Tax=Cucumis melo var. makuwa TaxID=1194695 RepID=A0A5A7VMN7_CUCMM|nr:gag/pol protein [Cucumis melo var. makuwa]
MQSQPLQNLGPTVNLWFFCSSTGFSSKPGGFLVFSDALSILEVHKSNQKLYLVIFSLSTLSVLYDNDAFVEIELPVPNTLPTSAESFRSNSRSAGIIRGDDVCGFTPSFGLRQHVVQEGAWVHLSKEQCPKTPQEVEDMRRIPYASAVGSLMYAMLCTRPSIYYAVEIVSRYQSNPGLDHWTAVKIILKYLRRMRDYMWAVSNSKEPRSHKRGKHIERKYHLIREIVQRGDVIVTKIASKHNIVDPFTKTLTAKVFQGHLKSLGLRDMYIR